MMVSSLFLDVIPKRKVPQPFYGDTLVYMAIDFLLSQKSRE
jgi:hypothetical protein